VRVVEYRDPASFADRVAPLLADDPVGTTVLATVLDDVVQGARDYPDSRWLAVETLAGTLSGVAMHTPPHRSWLAPMPAEAAIALGGHLVDWVEAGRAVPGLAGARPTVDAVAAVWGTRRPEDRLVEVTAMRLYELGTLVPPPDVPGSARAVGPADLSLAVEWVEAFAWETGSPAADPEAAVRARASGQGSLLLWVVEGAAVSMAGGTATVAGVARIGPVYTPPAHRRRGYGAAVTAAATRLALDDGASGVCLFTDLANPTSNAIYQRLGFRPRGDYVEVDRSVG